MSRCSRSSRYGHAIAGYSIRVSKARKSPAFSAVAVLTLRFQWNFDRAEKRSQVTVGAAEFELNLTALQLVIQLRHSVVRRNR